jgi:hypothetical protein
MTSNPISRSPRFPLRFAMLYRQPNGSWSRGRTQNISESGVLFEADRMLNLGSRIEMDLITPWATAARIVCLGRVVRSAAPAMPEAPGVLAATITTYRLVSGHRRDPTGARAEETNVDTVT